ncbi:MAG: DUF4333 domain-containing protein [Actinomycetales bacterium]|nr:DUF4333 domain-containing protein [Actinomycetales bacterium]
MNEESISPPPPPTEDTSGETTAVPPVTPPPTAAAPAMVVLGVGEQSPGEKPPVIAWIAVGFAIFALVLALIPFATWGSGLFILTALILSIVALAKSRAAKGASITALILSLVAIPATIIMSILSVGLIIATGTTLDNFLIEQQIASGILEQLDIEATVTCPDLMVGTEGTVFQCEAVDINGDAVIVDVTVTDSVGGVTWEIRR